jgi:hypothetical protein
MRNKREKGFQASDLWLMIYAAAMLLLIFVNKY